MKSVNIGLLAFALSLATVSATAQNKDWGNIKRYEQSNQELLQQDNNGRRVVFMGNSITEGWVNTHPDFFQQNGYFGRGISGQTSYQYLVRFREDVINLHPKVVVINAGTNDVAENTGPYNEEYTFGNIVSMVELAKANKIKVILTSTLPAASFSWNKRITDAAQKIERLNQRVKAYAKKHRIPNVDYYTPMVVGEERALNPAYTKDGVHPTADGYDVMEALVQPVINKVL